MRANGLGINQFTLKDIMNVTGQHYYLGIEPNQLNLFCYCINGSVDKTGVYYTGKLAYFNETTRKTIDICTLQRISLKGLRLIRYGITKILVNTNIYKLLTGIYGSTLNDGRYLILYCADYEIGECRELGFVIDGDCTVRKGSWL